MSTCPSPVQGNGRGASTDTDLEARGTSTGVPLALLAALEPAGSAASPTCMPHGTADTTSDSVGATPSRASRESQRDAFGGDFSPPSYADTELPAYSADANAEPATLAMYLFKLGFLFPPLWVLGASILLFPLATLTDFEIKSEAERRELGQEIRGAELRWAQRCAWALFVLLVLAGVAAAIAFAVFHQ